MVPGPQEVPGCLGTPHKGQLYWLMAPAFTIYGCLLCLYWNDLFTRWLSFSVLLLPVAMIDTMTKVTYRRKDLILDYGTGVTLQWQRKATISSQHAC